MESKISHRVMIEECEVTEDQTERDRQTDEDAATHYDRALCHSEASQWRILSLMLAVHNSISHDLFA